jgi:hypothetical protein
MLTLQLPLQQRECTEATAAAAGHLLLPCQQRGGACWASVRDRS